MAGHTTAAAQADPTSSNGISSSSSSTDISVSSSQSTYSQASYFGHQLCQQQQQRPHVPLLRRSLIADAASGVTSADAAAGAASADAADATSSTNAPAMPVYGNW
jgi:hypothetical protein